MPNANQTLYAQLVIVEALASFIRDNIEKTNLDKSLVYLMDNVVNNVHKSLFKMKDNIETLDAELAWKQLTLDL